MHRIRRATSLLLFLLLAQLTLVGSGYTCILPMADAGSGEMDAMPAMPGMGNDAAPTGPTDSPASPSEQCTFPWAPAGCTLMVPCAPNALSAHVAASVAAVTGHDAAPLWRAVIPASPIFTPEPPPPRG